MRKPSAIDIVKLYGEGNHRQWNAFLTNCYDKLDLEKLAETRRQLQAGMDIAVKRKLNTEKVILFFIRLQGSIENTMKKIIRKKYPNPCDDPLKAMNFIEAKGAKKARDEELERYLRKTGY